MAGGVPPGSGIRPVPGRGTGRNADVVGAAGVVASDGGDTGAPAAGASSGRKLRATSASSPPARVCTSNSTRTRAPRAGVSPTVIGGCSLRANRTPPATTVVSVRL